MCFKNRTMEIIDSCVIFGNVCQIWTIQVNGGHHVFFTNNTGKEVRIRFDFSEDYDFYLGTLNKNSVFGVKVHGVSFKKNFDVMVWNLSGPGNDYDDGNVFSKTILWN